MLRKIGIAVATMAALYFGKGPFGDLILGATEGLFGTDITRDSARELGELVHSLAGEWWTWFYHLFSIYLTPQ
jgi:hypothetical protein